MKRKMNLFLTGLFCFSCLTAPLSASAKVLNEECIYTGDEDTIEFNVTLESDLFQYTGEYHYYTANEFSNPSYSGRLETDATNANFVVTNVNYVGNTTQPTSYTLNGLNGNGEFFMAGIKAQGISECLDGMTLNVGDLLYIDLNTVMLMASWPGGIVVNPTIEGRRICDTVMEYAGNGYDLFGEDFNKILRYELYFRPTSADISNYTNLPVDKGEVNNDNEINLLDVVSVNKNLMIGADIGFYGQIAADVDKDGKVTPTDSLGILKYCVGLIDSFEELQ